METPPRLVLIGTGHVLDIAEAIDGAIAAVHPEWVFVELDPGRLRALMDRRAGTPQPTGGKWIHRKLQKFQEEIAAEFGTSAGDEMLAAVDAGQRIAAHVALVDRRVDVTLNRALKQLTFREKLRALGMMVKGGLQGMVPGRGNDAKAAVEQQLSDYTKDPEAALAELGDSFPTIRRVVIDERDAWMASRIRRALQPGQVGVAVVGDGHVPGMTKQLAGIELETYRMDDVRAGRLPQPVDDPNSATVSFRV